MSEFEDIRPYHDDEVESVIGKLLVDKEFLDFLGKYHSPRASRFFPGLTRIATRQVLKRVIGGVTTISAFQGIVAGYAKKIVAETMTGFDYSGVENLSSDRAYLYVGNHRDIAGDSMLVDYALWLSNRDTVQIAVGDNLMQRDFATNLMRLNRSFFIRRSAEGAKKIYAALLQSSRFIHHSILEGHSVWIAQSEGRAKDGFDVTDPAIIKMFALAKRKQALAETIACLNVVPVSIAYEYDPCDYLKAKELYCIESQGGYEKPAGEDLLSLVKGLGEFKGKVCLSFGQPLEGDFSSPEAVASELDKQILDNFQLYYINYWALHQLALIENPEDNYIDTWKALGESIFFSDTQAFEARYLACPLAWRHHWLKMYANPVVNKYQKRAANLSPC